MLRKIGKILTIFLLNIISRPSLRLTLQMRLVQILHHRLTWKTRLISAHSEHFYELYKDMQLLMD